MAFLPGYPNTIPQYIKVVLNQVKKILKCLIEINSNEESKKLGLTNLCALPLLRKALTFLLSLLFLRYLPLTLIQ